MYEPEMISKSPTVFRFILDFSVHNCFQNGVNKNLNIYDSRLFIRNPHQVEQQRQCFFSDECLLGLGKEL